jgi:hypothetical protein
VKLLSAPQRDRRLAVASSLDTLAMTNTRQHGKGQFRCHYT